MKIFKVRKIRTKFFVPIITFIIVFLLIVTAVRTITDRNYTYNNINEKLNSVSELAVLSMSDPLWNLNYKGVIEIGEAMFEDKEIATVEVKSNDGKTIYSNKVNHEAYQGEYLRIIEKSIMKGEKEIGLLRIGVTSFYRDQHVQNNMIKSLIELAAISIVLFIVIFFISSKVLKPMKQLIKGTEVISQGQLDYRIEVNTNDEFKILTEKFNLMAKNLEQTVMQVKNAASELYETIDSLNEATETTQNITTEFSHTSEHIAEGIETQSGDIKEISNVISEMGESISHVKKDVESALSVSKDSTEKAQEGMSTVSLTVEKMDRLYAFVKDASKSIKKLQEHSKKIVSFVAIISDITEQTNLLALNASIEAARAGEAGKGFAVVAGEVQNLAEESGHAASEIKNVVDTIEKEINQIVNQMEEGVEHALDGKEIATSTGDNIEEIVKITDALENYINGISQETNTQVSESEEIVAQVNEISEIAENNAAGAEEYLGSIENQKEVIRTMVSEIQNINSVSKKMLETIEKFNV